VSFVYTGTRYF